MESLGLVLVLAIIAFSAGAANAATFTITNNCPFTIWPAGLTGSGTPLPSTGFELSPQTSSTLDVPAPWSGRFWGRTGCTTNNATRKFTCITADCGSGQLSCNNAGAIPPASLVEFTLSGYQDQDFYDVSLVDGFNLPISVTPQGGSGQCPSTSCRANINQVCPPELAVAAPSDGTVFGCKSACLAFNAPMYCCTEEFNSPEACKPTEYSRVFKGQCPQAYSYAYDDKSSTFTCPSGANYVVTFCPSNRGVNATLSSPNHPKFSPNPRINVPMSSATRGCIFSFLVILPFVSLLLFF